MSHNTFIFETEFSETGDIITGATRKFYPREEVETLTSTARQEGERSALNSAQAKGLASIEHFARQLAQIHSTLTRAADEVRHEAAELAMIAAKQIAATALDINAERAAIDAVLEAVKSLKTQPNIVLSVTPEVVAPLSEQIRKLQGQGVAMGCIVEANPAARPGDWRLEWAHGAVGFDRKKIEDAIDAAIRARLQDPIEQQLDMFSAA